MPASRNIPPQRAHSFSAGYSIALDQDNYEFSSEPYYKRLHNQMESAGALIDMISQQYIIEDKIYIGGDITTVWNSCFEKPRSIDRLDRVCSRLGISPHSTNKRRKTLSGQTRPATRPIDRSQLQNKPPLGLLRRLCLCNGKCPHHARKHVSCRRKCRLRICTA